MTRLHLGVQTNAGNVQAQADWLVRIWRPRGHGPGRIVKLIDTDYFGRPTGVETGYAELVVEYPE